MSTWKESAASPMAAWCGACWQPTGAGLSCVGPWQFYLPLGLPMVAQKIVMLLHYPPYSAMQQADYLNNATLNRWRRLLGSVGVPDTEWTLYTATVDIFPIAAPGSGQSGCFTTTNAVNYFGAKGSGYVPAMLQSLLVPPDGNATAQTRPVIVFGGEALGFWLDLVFEADAELRAVAQQALV